MRVATFNVLHGRSMGDGVVDADRLGASVATIDADVLALQEVDRGQPRSGGLDLTAVAAEAMGAVWHRFVPTVLGTPGGDWVACGPGDDDGSGPAYGVALLSRLPVRRTRLVALPAAPVRSPVLIPGPKARVAMLQDEPRVAVVAELEADGDDGSGNGSTVTVAATHLSFVPGWNVRQLRRLRTALHVDGERYVIAGDLNLPGAMPSAVSGLRRLARGASYPAGDPRLQLDHLLGSKNLRAEASGSRTLAISDHCAVWADIIEDRTA